MPFNKLLALAAKSQISLDFAHLRVTFRRWWGNFLCYEYPLLHFANFIAYNGNLKEKLAPLNFTTWTCLIFGLSERTVCPLVRCSLISEWLTEEVPHHPKIKQTVQVATPFRLRDVAPQLLNKEKVDWNSRVPEPFGSFQLWKERIERLEEKCKWTIKVKIYHKIELLMDQWMSTPFFYWADNIAVDPS